jgi:hypothetical protein
MSTNYVSSVMLRPKKVGNQKKNPVKIAREPKQSMP